MRLVFAPLLFVVVALCGALSACSKPNKPLALDVNAVRCDCACGLGPIEMGRTVEVCIDKDMQPAHGTVFTEADIDALCEEVCIGGVQAQAQESLVAEGVIDDSCSLLCRQDGVPEALTVDQCKGPSEDERIDCSPDRCPVDLPGDPELVRYYLLRCTTVVDDSRADPNACGPDRPTRPLCVVDVEDGPPSLL